MTAFPLFLLTLLLKGAFLGGAGVNAGDPGSTPGQEDPLEEGTATTPVFLLENPMAMGS